MDQLDVKTAFLHGYLEETIYMVQPKGFEVQGKEYLYCLLKKSIYGLKQSPRCWYRRFDDFIASLGFQRSSYDMCVYINPTTYKDKVYLLLYVDDMLLARSFKEELTHVKSLLSKEFDMKNLGKLRKILGIDITKDRDQSILSINQTTYCEKVTKRFNLTNARLVTLPVAQHFKLSATNSPSETDTEHKLQMVNVPYS